MQYEGIDGYAGSVVELEVNKTTGKVRVTRVVCSHDVGIIINPDGIRAQLEGNVVHGISRALMEEVSFSRKAATTTNFESYQVMRFTDLPEIKFALINRTSQPPKGVGENLMTAIPAAVANAIFDATGVRMRRLAVHPRPREGGARSRAEARPRAARLHQGGPRSAIASSTSPRARERKGASSTGAAGMGSSSICVEER